MDGVYQAQDHAQAAALAFSFGRPVLLAVGSKNLAPYGRQAKERGILAVARVLSTPDSLAACAAAGFLAERVLAERGPFSLAQNLEHIRRFAIGVVVTKDGGEAGGMEAKLAAARETGCAVVLVSRPLVAANGLATLEAVAAAARAGVS